MNLFKASEADEIEREIFLCVLLNLFADVKILNWFPFSQYVYDQFIVVLLYNAKMAYIKKLYLKVIKNKWPVESEYKSKSSAITTVVHIVANNSQFADK